MRIRFRALGLVAVAVMVPAALVVILAVLGLFGTRCPCDLSQTSVAWRTSFSQSAKGYVVDAAILSALPRPCRDRTVTVTLLDAAGSELGKSALIQTASSWARPIVVPFASPARAEDVQGISVVLTGCESP